MTYVPGFSFPIGGNTVYSQTAASDVLPDGEYPMIYTTTGPLPIANGIAVTTDSLIFDPNQVSQGNFDCGIFGSQA